MIASGPIEFGPYADEGLAREAAARLNASNMQRTLTGSVSPASIALTWEKAPRR